MTVADLRKMLDGLQEHMPVVGYWDSHHWAAKGAKVEERVRINSPREQTAFVIDVSEGFISMGEDELY